MDSLFHKEVSVLICILFDAYGLMFTKFEAEKVGMISLRIMLIGTMLTVISACVCLFRRLIVYINF